MIWLNLISCWFIVTVESAAGDLGLRFSRAWGLIVNFVVNFRVFALGKLKSRRIVYLKRAIFPVIETCPQSVELLQGFRLSGH